MLSKSRQFAALLLLLLLLVAGCGGSSQPAAEGASPPPSGGNQVSKALLGVRDFPPGTSVVSSISQPCDSPIKILAENGGETAVSKVFELAGTKVKESVGAFPAISSATAAFFGLISEARGRCMKRSIAALYPDHSKVTESRDLLGFGEQELWTRYTVETRQGKPKAGIDVVSMRMGRCVGEILIFNPGGRRFSVTHEVSADASRLLGENCPHVGGA